MILYCANFARVNGERAADVTAPPPHARQRGRSRRCGGETAKPAAATARLWLALALRRCGAVEFQRSARRQRGRKSPARVQPTASGEETARGGTRTATASLACSSALVHFAVPHWCQLSVRTWPTAFKRRLALFVLCCLHITSFTAQAAHRETKTASTGVAARTTAKKFQIKPPDG